MALIDHIPSGKRNAVTRAQLAALAGHDDRSVRKEIKHLVSEGVPIMSASDHPGYWLAESIEEVKRFLREYDARERSSRKTTARLRQLVAMAEGVEVVHVRSHDRRIKRQKEVEGQLTL